MTNVRQILDHMTKARCLYCGKAFKERKELVPHIGNCTVYADYRSDVDKLREEVAVQARRGDEALSEIVIPPEKQGDWRVEEEFINAIRGLETVTHTSFEDGVKYMEFTEAVTRSAQAGTRIFLPL